MSGDPADRYPAEEAAALISALSEVEDQPQVVLALVDVGRTAERTPQLLRSQLQVPVLTIHDPLRAAARRSEAADCRPGPGWRTPVCARL